jgi:16S rRNA (guanine527-N7)-methyltransferase
MAMGLVEKVVLHNKRVETLPAIGADVITARAFAPLAKLFELSHTHAHDKTLWILPKGQNVALELEEATKCWTFHVKQVHSETDDQAKLLLIHSVRRSR